MDKKDKTVIPAADGYICPYCGKVTKFGKSMDTCIFCGKKMKFKED